MDKKYIGYMVVMKATTTEAQMNILKAKLETATLVDYIVPVELDDLLSVLNEEKPS